MSIRFNLGTHQAFWIPAAVPAAFPCTCACWGYLTGVPATGNYHHLVGFNSGTSSITGNAVAVKNTGGVRNWAIRTSGGDVTGSVVVQSVWNHFALVQPANDSKILYRNGVVEVTSAAAGANDTQLAVGSWGTIDPVATANLCNARIAHVRWWDRALTQAEVLAEMNSPVPVIRAGLRGWTAFANTGDYQDRGPYRRAFSTLSALGTTEEDPPNLIAPRDPRRRRVRAFLPLDANAAAGGGVTGATDATLGALTAATAGTVPVTATVVRTLGDLTASAAATVPVTGTTAAGNLGALTLSAAVAVPVAGTAAPTLGALTSAAAGTVPVTGALARTLGAMTANAAGAAAVTATAALTLAPLTVAAAGTAGATATLTKTLGALTAIAAGTAPVFGFAAATLAPLAAASAAAVPAAGALAKTLGTLTATAAGGAAGASATLDRTLAPVALAAAAAAAVSAAAFAALAPAGLAAAGTVPVKGAASATLAALGLAAGGTGGEGGVPPPRWLWRVKAGGQVYAFRVGV